MKPIKLRYKLAVAAAVAGAFAVSGLLFAFRSGEQFIRTHQTENIVNVLSVLGTELENEIAIFEEDILTIANLNSVTRFIEARDALEAGDGSSDEDRARYDAAFKNVQDTLLSFIQNKSEYFQIRYLDESGAETIRAQRPSTFSEVVLVPEAQLSDKSDRYYFVEARNLTKGQVFVSDLDLNVEDDRITKPLLPTMRFATPLFNARGENRGVIVINIFGEQLLELVERSPIARVDLIDQDGYYLLHPHDQSKEWGKQLGGGEKFTNWDAIYAARQEDFRFGESIVHREGRPGTGTNYILRKVEFDPLDSSRFFLLADEVSDEKLTAQFTALGRDVLFQYVLIIGIIVLAYMFFIYWQTRQLSAISDAVGELEKGHMDVRIPVMQGGQFGVMAENVNHLIERSQKLDRNRYDFINSASHQLRTPSSALRMQLDVIMDDLKKAKVPKDIIEQLEDIGEQNKRSILIMNDLLKYMELGETYYATDRKEIDVKELVDGLVSGLQPRAEDAKVKVIVAIPDGLQVRAESGVMKIALLNLIGNAIDYSNKKGVVTVSAEKQKDDVLFTIEDEGIGIPKEDLVNVFDQFFRAANAYSKNSVGSGLGLPIAQRIVKGHDGEIWLESEEGKGTKVFFTIPS